MPAGDIETVPYRGRWRNVIAGTYKTQEEAADAGRKLARKLKVEWLLKSRLGRIRQRNTYTKHDPPASPH